jgi:hypothetical protein
MQGATHTSSVCGSLFTLGVIMVRCCLLQALARRTLLHASFRSSTCLLLQQPRQQAAPRPLCFWHPPTHWLRRYYFLCKCLCACLPADLPVCVSAPVPLPVILQFCLPCHSLCSAVCVGSAMHVLLRSLCCCCSNALCSILLLLLLLPAAMRCAQGGVRHQGAPLPR